MSDVLDPVVMIRAHVEGTLSVVNSALGYHRAMDLARAYESGRPNPNYSKLTKQLEAQVRQLKDYLVAEPEDVDDDE